MFSVTDIYVLCNLGQILYVKGKKQVNKIFLFKALGANYAVWTSCSCLVGYLLKNDKLRKALQEYIYIWENNPASVLELCFEFVSNSY